MEKILLRDAFSDFINLSKKGKRLLPSGKRISKGVIENYQYCLMLLTEFEQEVTCSIEIIIIKKTTIRALKREKNYWKKFFLDFSNFLFRKKAHYDNYVSNVFKTIKAVFNFLKSDKGLPISDFYKTFRVPSHSITPVVLIPEQLQYLIHDTKLDERLSSIQKRVKDILIFGCTTGLRITDLMSLTKNHLRISGNKYYIMLYTQKTGASVNIPLPDYCLNIVEKYQKQKHKYLLPHLTKNTINRHIKLIGKNAGWTAVLPKYRTRQGQLTELKKTNGQSWKFYEHLTAHTMRRTAITTLLMLGVEEAVVRTVSGHAPGSKEFYKYVVLAKNYVDTQVSNAFDRLGTMPVQ